MKDKTFRELITVRSQILLELHDKFQLICCNTIKSSCFPENNFMARSHIVSSAWAEILFWSHRLFMDFSTICPNWKSLSSFWNWAMIFSHFHFKRISFFQKLGWNSPCHHPLSIYSFFCLAINSFFYCSSKSDTPSLVHLAWDPYIQELSQALTHAHKNIFCKLMVRDKNMTKIIPNPNANKEGTLR